MQIVSSGDNLHEMSNPVFWKKNNMKTIINLWSAEFAQRVVKVNYAGYLLIPNGTVEGLMRLHAHPYLALSY